MSNGHSNKGKNGKKLKYKGILVNMLGIPVSAKKIQKHPSTRVIPKRFYLQSFGPRNVGKSDSKKYISRNLLLMYDIPTFKKTERDWFRRQLKSLDFMMIQKSVWVGPSPLPADFSDYIKGIGLESNLKTIKLAKSYTLTNSPTPFKF